jgi:hypothetical protein
MAAPKPRGGSQSVLGDYTERILALVAEQPDRTLDELIAAMHKRWLPLTACAFVFAAREPHEKRHK